MNTTTTLISARSFDATIDLDAADTATVARYADYTQAQAAVDLLSDQDFPVSQVRIVSGNLRMVEQVTGRLTSARAAVLGAFDGALFGVFLGIFVGLFSAAAWLALLFTGPALGAAFGALGGFIGHRLTDGQRDFLAHEYVVAGHYDLVVEPHLADRAREVLRQGGLLAAAA